MPLPRSSVQVRPGLYESGLLHFFRAAWLYPATHHNRAVNKEIFLVLKGNFSETEFLLPNLSRMDGSFLKMHRDYRY